MFVLDRSLPRDILTKFILCLNWMIRYRLNIQWSHKWQVESTHRHFFRYDRLSFECGVQLWCDGQWEYFDGCQHDVASTNQEPDTERDILMFSDGILNQSQMSLLLRNLCGTRPKDPRQQSSKPGKWKVHDLSFSKHQKLLKNSS